MAHPTPEILNELSNLQAEQNLDEKNCICENGSNGIEQKKDSQYFNIWEDEWDNIHGDIFLFI
jgi:hypothetical protein